MACHHCTAGLQVIALSTPTINKELESLTLQLLSHLIALSHVTSFIIKSYAPALLECVAIIQTTQCAITYVGSLLWWWMTTRAVKLLEYTKNYKLDVQMFWSGDLHHLESLFELLTSRKSLQNSPVRSEGSLILRLSSTVSDENLGAVLGMPTRGVGIVLINLFTCFGFVLITKKWNNNKQWTNGHVYDRYILKWLHGGELELNEMAASHNYWLKEMLLTCLQTHWSSIHSRNRVKMLNLVH